MSLHFMMIIVLESNLCTNNIKDLDIHMYSMCVLDKKIAETDLH